MNIFKASRNGDYDRVKELLDNGADVNIINDNNNNNTPLHYACRNGCIKIIRLLIKKGANINSMNIYNISSLAFACYNKKLEIVKLLLENNANVNFVDNDGYTLLHDVCYNDGSRMITNDFIELMYHLIDLVISYGADNFTVKNNREETPLDYLRTFEEYDFLRIVKDLVKKYENYTPKGKLIKAAKKKK